MGDVDAAGAVLGRLCVGAFDDPEDVDAAEVALFGEGGGGVSGLEVAQHPHPHLAGFLEVRGSK
ncbi:hypothetical protein BN2537_16913 [Streptomyces venezuelae]|nr:hypothetical protein BN2537_16913 [Streptomyces venezuelae]